MSASPMNVWLCPVKPRSWRIIRKFKTFGAPIFASEVMKQVRPDDLLVIHLLGGHIKGIVAVCRVISQVYEDHEDFWGKNRYPLRVRIEIIPELQRRADNLIPLGSLLGAYLSSGLSVEPFLQNINISHVSAKQYESLKKVFAEN